MKAATAAYRGHCQRHFISIHAAREGGDSGFRAAPEMVGISIHAAREGGDPTFMTVTKHRSLISIHAAREGGDYASAEGAFCQKDFNPRRP